MTQHGNKNLFGWFRSTLTMFFDLVVRVNKPHVFWPITRLSFPHSFHYDKPQPHTESFCVSQVTTRHRASTSMYSLTFCVRFLLPERHQRKPAVQATAVMLRTPPVDSQSLVSQPRPLPIYRAQFWERPRQPPVSGQQRAQTPPAGRSHYVVISRDGRKLVIRVRVMLP